MGGLLQLRLRWNWWWRNGQGRRPLLSWRGLVAVMGGAQEAPGVRRPEATRSLPGSPLRPRCVVLGPGPGRRPSCVPSFFIFSMGNYFYLSDFVMVRFEKCCLHIYICCNLLTLCICWQVFNFFCFDAFGEHFFETLHLQHLFYLL